MAGVRKRLVVVCSYRDYLFNITSFYVIFLAHRSSLSNVLKAASDDSYSDVMLRGAGGQVLFRQVSDVTGCSDAVKARSLEHDVRV